MSVKPDLSETLTWQEMRAVIEDIYSSEERAKAETILDIVNAARLAHTSREDTISRIMDHL